jgi:hypothetical protein
MWIYIDPSTAYLDARIGEQFDGIIFIRDITPIHPTENALRTTAAPVGGPGHLAARASMLSAQTWHRLVQRVSPSSP